MGKRFSTAIGLFILAVAGAFTAVFTPLLGGVERNLGAGLRLPLHSPILPHVVDVIDGWLGQRTPPVRLAVVVVLGLVALVLVYAIADLLVCTITDLAAYLVQGRAERRKRKAEQQWSTEVTAARERPSALPTSTAEYEALWK